MPEHLGGTSASAGHPCCAPSREAHLGFCSPERQYRGRRSSAAARQDSRRVVAMDTEPLVFVSINWAELPKVPRAEHVER